MTGGNQSITLVQAVGKVLENLQRHPYPSIPSPPNISKRASVALILRVQPNPAHLPTETGATPVTITEFFFQPWVQHGELEVLFIKRAARKGDRWTSHVAFPGGKQDPGDLGDLETAIRETAEEVGLGLRSGVLACGHLPDRVVTASWGTVPLMVLCPFVFLLTSSQPPPLCLQPTEVASAHWVPLRLLLEPKFRTVVSCDISDRLARLQTGAIGHLIRYALRLSLGRMEYSAIRLWPSYSQFSTFAPDFLAPVNSAQWESPLVLWGLTKSIVEDFLEMIPPAGKMLELWRWPSLTAWDVGIVLWLLSRAARERNMEKVYERRLVMNQDCIYEDVEKSVVLVDGPKVEIGGLSEWERASSVDTLLEGYYGFVRKAVGITIVGRVVVGISIFVMARWFKLQR